MPTLAELEDRWMERLEHCNEMDDEVRAHMCRLVLEDLESVDGQPSAEGYWSTAEAASYTGLSESTIRNHCKAGSAGPLPGAVKREGRWLIPKQEVVAFMRDDEEEDVFRNEGHSSQRQPVF